MRDIELIYSVEALSMPPPPTAWRWKSSGIVHQINPGTNVVSDRTDAPIGFAIFPTQIHRSADRTRLYFLVGNSSDGEVFT